MTHIPLNRSHEENKGPIERLDMSITEIGFSVRTTNCLEERGIFTVNDLLRCTRDELLSIPNFGEKTLEEVYGCLAKLDFRRSDRALQALSLGLTAP